MRTCAVALALALAALPSTAAAQEANLSFSTGAPADYPGTVELGTGPGQPGEQWFRMNGSLQVRNTVRAKLTPFLPPREAATGTGVIVAPGGAFLGLAIEEEGFRIARWLADHGIAAFVLQYRVLQTPADPATFMREMVEVRSGRGTPSVRPPEDTPPQALADGIAALRHVRQESARYGVDPERIGMMGFSAGAFLTLSVTLADQQGARPAFIAPIYGRQRTVTPPPGAPPMYIVLAADDPLFGAAQTPGAEFALVNSWRKAGAPVEFHLLQGGGHGFGLGKAGTTSVDWIAGFHRWLAVNHMLAARPK